MILQINKKWVWEIAQKAAGTCIELVERGLSLPNRISNCTVARLEIWVLSQL